MRHRHKSKKLGRDASHRSALISALLAGLVRERRIKTTVTKAKMVKPLADRLVTLGRQGTLSARRQAITMLGGKPELARTLIDDLVPQMEGRSGGYTRVIKLGRRSSDSSEMALLEWVERVQAKSVEAEEPAAVEA